MYILFQNKPDLPDEHNTQRMLAFVLALWEARGAPFRIVDERDVFMVYKHFAFDEITL